MKSTLAGDLRAIRVCVELGFLRAEVLANWADAVLAGEEASDYAYCELALAARKSDGEILDILEEYRDAPSDAGTWEKVPGWVAEQVRSGELDTDHVIRHVWALASTAHPSEKLYLAFVMLEDEFACARDGLYGSLPEVRDHLLEVLDDLSRPGALAPGSA